MSKQHSKPLQTVCILPAFNESGKVGRVVEKVKATGEVDRIVVVDDCSTDDTRVEAEQAGAIVLRHAVNQGVGAAIRTGLDWGRNNRFDIAVIMAGDDQHEPTELSRVLGPLRAGKAQFVQGSRRLPGGRTVNGPIFREVSTRLYSLLFQALTGKRVTDGTNGFRAFLLTVLDEIDLHQTWLNTYELEPYLLYKAVCSTRIEVKEVPITIYYQDERKQYTKMKPIQDWWRIARPLLYLAVKERR